MTVTIADFQTRIESKIHANDITQVNDIYGLFLEAAGNVLTAADPRETKRTTTITNAIYDQVYNYVLPADLKDDCVIDIRPQTQRSAIDSLGQTSSRAFDRFREGFSVEDNSGVRTIRIAEQTLLAGATLNECDSLTSNGTWATGGNATDLAADSLNRISGSASLKFNISASGSTAYIENSTMTAVDLEDYVNVGALFVWVYIPSTTIITSVALRWGSDSSNYYSRTVTAAQDNTSFITGWNLLRFDWDGSTETGTVVDTAIDYMRVTFAYDGTTVNSCRVDSIVARIGSVYEIVYYSKYLFKTSAGVWIEKPTTTTDIVNLDTGSYNLLLYEMAFLVSQELQKKDGSFDVSFWEKERNKIFAQYKMRNKSQAIKRQQPYYSTANNRRR